MTALVFVDTNVFVYARDLSEPLKQPLAMQWLHELWSEDRGRTSMQVLNELYVTITRKLPSPLPTDDAWEFVHALMVWEPQEISGDLLLNAREVEQRYRFGWWDSLVVAAAQLQECSLLLSEDLQDGMQAGGVTIRNPFTMRVAENSAPYAVAAPSAARHRPRGRPRRVVRPAAS